MAVHYITVTPVTKLFKPATRAFGDIAIVGATDSDATGPTKTPVPITNPDSISYSSKTTLSSALTAAATTLTVTSISGLPSGPPFNIRIDAEVLTVTVISATTLTVTRAVNGTTAAAHANGASVVYTTKDKPVDDPIWFKGDLGKSVRKALDQTPGPTIIWAVRTDSADGTNALPNALAEVAKLDVQIVILANTPLISSTQGQTEIELLASHANTVSKTGSDGKERIGVAMLGKDVTNPTVITGNMSSARMVMVAHKSTEDAAAAVAGTIAGYEPHISLLLKPVSLSMAG